MDEDKEEWGNVKTATLRCVIKNDLSQADYLKRQWYICVCVCVFALFPSLALWSCGGRGSCGSGDSTQKGAVTFGHTRPRWIKRKKAQTTWWTENLCQSLPEFLSSLHFSPSPPWHWSNSLSLSLFSSEESVSHAPVSLSLTVNLHPPTPPIHHHSGYVWAYGISVYSRLFHRLSWYYGPLGGTVVFGVRQWTLFLSTLFFFFFSF